MEEVFKANNSDCGLVVTLIREANIALASFPKDSNDYIYNKERFADTIKVMRAVENTNPQCNEDISFIFNTINTIWEKGILTPLTLKNDEFAEPDECGIIKNIRYSSIYKFKDKIYNTNAYKCTIRAQYNHKENKQVPVEFDTYSQNPILFISKGGVITGEFIDSCFIRKEVIDKHCFTIQSIVNIPASLIDTENLIVIVVDHREPKLKALMNFYDVPVHISEKVKNMKLNIRKYKKL